MSDNLENTLDEIKEEKVEIKTDLEAGEKVFQIVLTLIGAFFVYQSLKLWQVVSAPKVSSAAALPLFVSLVWTIFSLIGVIQNIKKSTPLNNISSMGEKIKKGLAYALPKDVVVVIAAVIIYCLLLLVGLNFYIATAIFLYATICYLTKKDFVKNIIWVALVLLFAFLAFEKLFGIVFP